MLQLDVTLTLMALAMAPFMVGASFLLGNRSARPPAQARD